MEAYHVPKLHAAVLQCSEEGEVVCCITSVCTEEQTVLRFARGQRICRRMGNALVSPLCKYMPMSKALQVITGSLTANPITRINVGNFHFCKTRTWKDFRVRKRSCSGLKYLVLQPLTQLENILTSHYKYPVVSRSQMEKTSAHIIEVSQRTHQQKNCQKHQKPRYSSADSRFIFQNSEATVQIIQLCTITVV